LPFAGVCSLDCDVTLLDRRHKQNSHHPMPRFSLNGYMDLLIFSLTGLLQMVMQVSQLAIAPVSSFLFHLGSQCQWSTDHW
jgi:hypothetical protein